MANSIAYVRNYTSILDEVYKRVACSACLNSPRRMARAGRNAKEIMVPKIEVTGLGDYTRNVGYKTGSITYEFETKTFNYDRGIRLLADVMDVEEAGVLDCFVAAGSELQRTQVAPEADAFTFAEIAGHDGVEPAEEDFADAEAADVLASLRAATNEMDEAEVATASRILFITPTLKGVLDDFSLANPARSNRVLERFSRIVEVPQTRFYSAISLNSGDEDQFGYSRAEGSYVKTEDTSLTPAKTYYTESSGTYTKVTSPSAGSLSNYYELVGAGAPINFMVVERSAVIKFDKHVASRVFRIGVNTALEPHACTRRIQRSSVDLPRSHSRITSARGLPESTRATICLLNSSVNCLGCFESRMGPPFLEGPSDSHQTVQISIATSSPSSACPGMPASATSPSCSTASTAGPWPGRSGRRPRPDSRTPPSRRPARRSRPASGRSCTPTAAATAAGPAGSVSAGRTGW